MGSKPVRFHPEADQEYLYTLAWYNGRSPSAALDFESEFQRQSLLSRKHPSVGRSIFRPAVDTFYISFPSALCTATLSRKCSSLQWHTDIAAQVTGENDYASRSGLAISSG